jgi:hypothetical protein
VELKARTPRLIAAALLRDRFAEELDQPIRPVSEAQTEFLEDLDFWAKRGDPKPTTYAIAYALIELLDARRSLEFLRLKKPQAGDLVFLPLGSDRRKVDGSVDSTRLRMVSSIGNGGAVYFTGGGGAQAPIRAIEIVYRAEDQSAEAVKARTAVCDRASRQADGFQGVRTISAAKAARLSLWHVDQGMIVASDIDALRGVVEPRRMRSRSRSSLRSVPIYLPPCSAAATDDGFAPRSASAASTTGTLLSPTLIRRESDGA